MDFNAGNWKFRGTVSITGKASSYICPFSFKSKAIALEITVPIKKATWYRAGWISFESNGLTIPYKEALVFGRNSIEVPSFPDGQPYRIRFTPVRWVGTGRLKFWGFIPTRRPIRSEPIDLSEFTTEELNLLISSGIDPTKLRLSPESLEIVLPLLVSLRSPGHGSISAQLTTIIEEIRTMANTDIRSFKKMLSDLSKNVSDQALELATTGAKVVAMETTMVIENTFTVLKAGFLQDNGVWTYDLLHNMRTLTPDVSIYDTDPITGKAGDLQLIQTIAQSATTLRIELSPDEYDGNNFPLEVVIQARNSASAPGWYGSSNNVERFRLVNRSIEVTGDNGDTFANFYSDVNEAFLEPSSSQIYVIQQLENTAPQYFRELIGSATGFIVITLAEYDLAKALPTSVIIPAVSVSE